jgi:hypothetical protein
MPSAARGSGSNEGSGSDSARSDDLSLRSSVFGSASESDDDGGGAPAVASKKQKQKHSKGTRAGREQSDFEPGTPAEKNASQAQSLASVLLEGVGIENVEARLYVSSDVQAAELAELQAAKPFALAVAVVRYLVDLLWVTFCCISVTCIWFVVLRFTIFSGDMTVHRRERDLAWQFASVTYTSAWIGFISMYGSPAVLIWWHVGWKASRRYIQWWGLIGAIYFLATRLVLYFFVQMNLPQDHPLPRYLTSLTSVLFLVVWVLWTTGKIQKQNNLPRFRVKLFLSLLLLLVVGVMYFQLLPPLYFNLTDDWQRALMRVFFHPILFELAYTVQRIVGLSLSELSPSAVHALPAITLTLSSLYGRFLISALSSSVATLVVAAVLGAQEIALRLTVPWRDRQTLRLLDWFGRVRCCSALGDFSRKVSDRDDEPRRRRLYSILASADIVTENSSIIIAGFMLGLFSGMDPARAAFDTGIQLAMEVVVDFCCVFIETRHGLRVVENWNSRGDSATTSPAPGKRRRMTAHRKWALFTAAQVFIWALYINNEFFQPGSGLWVRERL